MIRIHVSAEDLTQTRFAFGPLWETVESYRVILDPGRRALHLPWISWAREEICQVAGEQPQRGLTAPGAVAPRRAGGATPQGEEGLLPPEPLRGAVAGPLRGTGR